jgi:hypothetical protein
MYTAPCERLALPEGEGSWRRTSTVRPQRQRCHLQPPAHRVLDPPSAHAVGEQVPGDAEQPGRGAARCAVEAVASRECTSERLGRQVGGGLRVPGAPASGTGPY